MKLAEYTKAMVKPLRPRSLIFFLKGDEVLLGFKKRGFGKGYLIGIGGKVEEHETAEEGVKREVKEEILVDVSELRKVATLNFYFPHIADESWNQQALVFVTRSWKGSPTETDEIRPQWFKKDQIPYDQMWDDAHYWLPKVLSGKKFSANFLFNDKLMVIDHAII